MTTLLSRVFRDRCTRCQLGQGRNCNCAKARKSRREITATGFWRMVLLAMAVGYGWMFWQLGVVWKVWS